MNLDELIVDSLSRACSDVFSTMMGVEITRGEVSVDTAAPDAHDGVVSLIGLAGSWNGTGSVGCSPVLACRICSQLLMTEVESVNEEVLDAVAELTNMIIGSAKTDLELHLGQLGLSIPTVVYGRNFKTRSMGTVQWVTLRFHWDSEELVVRMSLARRDETSHARLHAVSQSCAVEL